MSFDIKKKIQTNLADVVKIIIVIPLQKLLKFYIKAAKIRTNVTDVVKIIIVIQLQKLLKPLY